MDGFRTSRWTTAVLLIMLMQWSMHLHWVELSGSHEESSIMNAKESGSKHYTDHTNHHHHHLVHRNYHHSSVAETPSAHPRQAWLAGHADNRMRATTTSFEQSLNSMHNVTASVGRNATFECVFTDLKKTFLLAWLKFTKESRLLLATNDKVVATNGRISVRSHANTTFYLTIHDIRDEDRGFYMCQVNTIPMRSHTAYLEVNVPPSFNEKETSSDTDIREGFNVQLHCKAHGRPPPDISWRREDEKSLMVNAHNSSLAVSLAGEALDLVNVSRHQIGAYLCIASNGVPPTISKRIFLGVSFAPTVWTAKETVGVSVEASVVLECNLESYPRANVYWLKDSRVPPIIHSDHKYETSTRDTRTPYLFTIRLKIVKVEKADYGNYTCVSTNLHGESKATIKLYEVERIIKPHRTNYVSRARDTPPPTKIIAHANADLNPNKMETSRKLEKESVEDRVGAVDYVMPALQDDNLRANLNAGHVVSPLLMLWPSVYLLAHL